MLTSVYLWLWASRERDGTNLEHERPAEDMGYTLQQDARAEFACVKLGRVPHKATLLILGLDRLVSKHAAFLDAGRA